MKRTLIPRLLALALMTALLPSALAAPPPDALTVPSACYPTSVTRSEDGTQIRKVYDLGPEEDPAGIPRSDFEQEGYHYNLTDLLKQEAPEREERLHTETVTLDSTNKDMESVLALLPAQREFTTDDGLTGVLSLKLDTVQVNVVGYGSSTRAVSATRSYPNLSGQDTSFIPKTITDTSTTSPSTTVGFIEVTSSLYYSNGSLGILKIPSIGLTVGVYEGTGSAPLLKGAGHFEGISIWNGNVAIAGVRPDRA